MTDGTKLRDPVRATPVRLEAGSHRSPADGVCIVELASIIGKPRVIPIFSKVQGPGNNAQYTIVKWFGIRISDVQLTGAMSKKHVTIQAAPLIVHGIVPSATTGTSSYVYSPVVLVK